MKVHFKMLIALCAIMLSTTAFSQEQKATINEEGKVLLPVSDNMSDTYLIDIAADRFDSQQELMAYFDERSGGDINFRVLRDRNQVVVILNRKNHPDRTASQWNTRLSELPDLKEALPTTKTY